MARRVSAPDGLEWVVRRRWVSWHPRWRWLRRRRRKDGGENWWNLLDIPLDQDLGWIILGFLVLLFLVFFVIPALVFVAEVLLFLVLVAAFGLLRTILRKPWVVEAEPVGEPARRLRWGVVGWRRSGQVVGEVAEALSLGQTNVEPEGAVRIEPPAVIPPT